MSGWRDQFARPHGPLGYLAGLLMTRGKEGFVLDLLEQADIEPSDHVLEIGFGPGVGIQTVSHLVPAGRVVGVEISRSMVRMARRRNRQPIRDGRVELRIAAVSDLPFSDESFDVAFATNSVQFWPDLASDLREVNRVLRPGGRLALGVQLPKWMASPERMDRMAGEVEDRVKRAGFRDVARSGGVEGGSRAFRLLARR